MSSQLDEAALAAANAILDQARNEDAPSPDAPQEAEEAVEQEPEAEFDLNAELPEDLEDEDFSVEDTTYDEPDEEDEDYLDPAVTEERNRRIAAEKKLQYMEKQRMDEARKNWVLKDGKRYLLADIKTIAKTATSRREFNKQALAEHNRIKELPGVQKLMRGGPKTDEQMRDAWGSPTSGAGLVPAEAEEAQLRVDKAFKTKGLTASISEMIKSGLIR